MTFALAPNGQKGIRDERTHPVRLDTGEIQRAKAPAHGRVQCTDCGHQIDPRTAVMSDEGYICPHHEE